jgi:hypothetical protein
VACQFQRNKKNKVHGNVSFDRCIVERKNIQLPTHHAFKVYIELCVSNHKGGKRAHDS